MKLSESIKKLCSPAYVYLVISAIALIFMMFQNAGNTNKYCVGDFECEVGNTASIFAGKVLYVVIWTFILNAICDAGYKQISWFLVLLPFLLMAIGIGLLLLNGLKQ